MNNFEKEVRKALIDRNMNLSDLAKVLNISLSYLYDILKEARKGSKQKKKICIFLGIED